MGKGVGTLFPIFLLLVSGKTATIILYGTFQPRSRFL